MKKIYIFTLLLILSLFLTSCNSQKISENKSITNDSTNNNNITNENTWTIIKNKTIKEKTIPIIEIDKSVIENNKLIKEKKERFIWEKDNNKIKEKIKINKNIIVTFISDSSVKSIKNRKIELLKRLKSEKSLLKAKFIELDYSNKIDKKEINKIMITNWLTHLPIVYFNTNKLFDNWSISDALLKTENWFSLYVWANYNPISKKIEKINIPSQLQK